MIKLMNNTMKKIGVFSLALALGFFTFSTNILNTKAETQEKNNEIELTQEQIINRFEEINRKYPDNV